jgi:hypothetical protein
VESPFCEGKRKQRLDKIDQLNRKAVLLKSSTKDRDLGLKRALTKDPTHLDPFAEDPPTARANAPAYEGPSSSSTPYWGVGLGAGPVAGGLVEWGLASQDPHVLHADDCAKRGACAAGAGGGADGSGYCASTGPGICKSLQCAMVLANILAGANYSLKGGLVPSGCFAGNCMAVVTVIGVL